MAPISQRAKAQRPRAERRLEWERALVRSIVETVLDPLLLTDSERRIVIANSRAALYFSSEVGDGEDRRRAVSRNNALLSAALSRRAIEEGRVDRRELPLVDPLDGSDRLFELTSTPIMTPERGEVTAVVTILHDLTEQMEKNALYEELKKASSLLEEKVRDATAELVRQNELLQRQALELEAASSAKSQFLANMSHEFRTPLNAILGYTSMMLEGISGPIPPSFARPLSRIDANGRHLLMIINDVLDIARIEAGRMPLHLTRLAPADVVREVLSELEPLIVRSGLDVRSRIGANVPVLRTDRAKVKQIVMNLVSNALKFTPKGSVVISVRLGRRRSEVSVSVADTGIGIAAADQENVFQAFRQVDSSPTRPYGGTGLGLAISRRLARLLGGDIRLTSEIGRGSTFKLTLPTKGARKGAAR